jgi:tetraacyldisaccharide 4'-kinase
LGALRGQGVLAVSGVGEPDAFAAQLGSAGAAVQAMPFGDHHPYTAADVARIIQAAGPRGLVVTTAKDAVKLASLWPPDSPRCLVALLGVTIATGAHVMDRLVDRVVGLAQRSNPVSADAPPMRA